MATSAASLSLPTFTTITIRLDRTNFTFRRAQVLATVRAHGFESFLTGESTPPVRRNLDHESSTVNPDFEIWNRRDQFLFGWLLSSISEPMLGHVSRCTTSAKIWKVLESLFRSQSKARVLSLKFQLQMLKKGELSIDEYNLKMKTIADSILAVGQELSDDDLILYILGGLGADYESVIVHLTARSQDLTLADVQYMLQKHEIRLKQFHPSVETHVFPQANIATCKYPQFEGKFSRGGSHIRGRGEVDMAEVQNLSARFVVK